MLELAEASFTNHLSMCCREVLAENVADLEEDPIFAKLSGEDLYQVLKNPALPQGFDAMSGINLLLNWMNLQAPDTVQREEMRLLLSTIDVPDLPEKDIYQMLLRRPTLLQNPNLL